MVLFLYTFNINRARTSGKFYQELIRQSYGKNIAVVDISRHSIAEIGEYIDRATLIVFDNSIILSMSKVPMLARNFYTNKNVPKEFYFDVWNLVNRADKPVFLMHPSSDLHAVNFGLERDTYLEILKRITGIFWPFHQFPLEMNDAHDRYPLTTLEAFHLGKRDLLNIWEEIKANVPISIDFPHCLPYEIMEKKTGRKIWDIIIPAGAKYNTRKIAREAAAKEGLFVAPFQSNSRWLVNIPYHLYNRIFQREHSTKLYQTKSLRLYRHMISLSSVSFACGSELRYFVRKFIEIPAFRSAMIAYPSLNFADYGFEDGVHYLHAFPEEAGEKTKYLLRNKSFSEKLIENAWNLVAEQHTASVRVEQVLSCLHFFQQGKLKSASYKNGNFEII